MAGKEHINMAADDRLKKLVWDLMDSVDSMEDRFSKHTDTVIDLEKEQEEMKKDFSDMRLVLAELKGMISGGKVVVNTGDQTINAEVKGDAQIGDKIIKSNDDE